MEGEVEGRRIGERMYLVNGWICHVDLLETAEPGRRGLANGLNI